MIVLVIAGAAVGGGSDGNERQSGWDSLSGRAKDLALRHFCSNRDFDVDHSPTEDDCGCVADYTESHYSLEEARTVTGVLPAYGASPSDVSASARTCAASTTPASREASSPDPSLSHRSAATCEDPCA